jgi:HAD superfamily hydrolase (TIGR01484 family)
MQMLICDWDGTLYQNNRLEKKLLRQLQVLGDRNVVRAVATGRNLFSARKVISPEFPIDYLIFSSGAGVLNWPKQKLIKKYSLQRTKLLKVVNYLQNENLDFMVHRQIPENHWFFFHRTVNHNPDFERRMKIYQKYQIPVANWEEKASQVLAIVPENPEYFQKLKKRFPDLTIIRTTSPLDGSSLWIEIFPKNVSKSQTASWLSKKIGITTTIAVGNDYNDEDLLHWSDKSYIISSAPEVLKQKFTTCNTVSEVIKNEFGEI